jgi:mono/diheme cytochrome c family protein
VTRIFSVLIFLGLLLLSPGSGETNLAVQARTILRKRCYACHGANGEAERGINVLDRAGLIETGVLEPGDKESMLLRVMETGRMPLKGPRVPAREVEIIRRWVMSGAHE